MNTHTSILSFSLTVLIGLSAVSSRGLAAEATSPSFEVESSKSPARLAVDTRSSPVPWSNLEFRNDPNAFQFAIVSDRTGGARWGVFQDAIAKLNLLQPEFVMSVGDMIQGYTDDLEVLNREWDEFSGFIGKLEVPFFYIPGNHDMTNPTMAALWEERFGAAFYSFIYKDVLFLCLNSNDGAMHQIGSAQIEWVKQVLEKQVDVRWTLVFVHRPFWDSSDPDNLAYWAPIENALSDREYTVFAGHVHSYTKLIRNDRRHFTLATTGGGSKLRGRPFGEFDQVAWITVTDSGPIVANLMLDGIWDENVRNENFRFFVRTLTDGGRSQMPSILCSSDALGLIEREIRITNDLDVPIHYAVDVSVSDGNVLLSDARFDLIVPPNSVETVPLVLKGEGEIENGFAVVAELEWAADVRFGDEYYAMDGVSSLHAVKSLPIRAQSRPVTVDSRLDDWSELPFTVENPTQIKIQPETWHGPDDGHFRFGVASDEEYLFIAIEVIDDQIVAVPGTKPWVQDGVEIRIDARQPPANRTRERDLVFVALGPGDRSDNGIPIYGENALPAGTQYACSVTATGFAAEVAIPLSAINERAGGEWKNFRLNVQVDDTDGDEEGTSQLNWQPDWRSAENIPQSGTFVK
ncbi:MAG: hypothetical protein DRP71_10670 [Verrucomicrobia bacterium]|nr:MAG: hypothetical protein DRP71_10670 [Verrucomicrobiota bacterium]